MPATSLPKTTCLPSRCGASSQVMNHWDWFVSGPLLAMERQPGASNLRWVCSSLKVLP